MRNFIFLLVLGLSAVSTLNSCSDPDQESTAIENRSCSIAIEGMMCEKGCKTTIQNRLIEMEGVIHAEVEYDIHTAFITYDGNQLNPTKIMDMINTIGDGLYSSSLIEDKDIENIPMQSEGSGEVESASVLDYTFEVPDLTGLFTNIL